MYHVKDHELMKNLILANTGIKGLKYHCAGHKHPTHPCRYCAEQAVEFVTLEVTKAAEHSLEYNTPMWISNDLKIEDIKRDLGNIISYMLFDMKQLIQFFKILNSTNMSNYQIDNDGVYFITKAPEKEEKHYVLKSEFFFGKQS